MILSFKKMTTWSRRAAPPVLPCSLWFFLVFSWIWSHINYSRPNRPKHGVSSTLAESDPTQCAEHPRQGPNKEETLLLAAEKSDCSILIASQLTQQRQEFPESSVCCPVAGQHSDDSENFGQSAPLLNLCPCSISQTLILLQYHHGPPWQTGWPCQLCPSRRAWQPEGDDPSLALKFWS